jgi:hypothetical protein
LQGLEWKPVHRPIEQDILWNGTVVLIRPHITTEKHSVEKPRLPRTP